MGGRGECGGRTLRDGLVVVRAVVRRHVVVQPHAALELLLEQVALVQEEHDADVREQLVLDDALPEDERVLEPVHTAVLEQAFVKGGDRREEQDRMDVGKVREPCSALVVRVSAYIVGLG